VSRTNVASIHALIVRRRLMTSYSECPTDTVSAANGVDYVYREVGEGETPLVLLQHFRGNLDYWDPPLVDALASRRRLV
jgi:hypothetical protein